MLGAASPSPGSEKLVHLFLAPDSEAQLFHHMAPFNVTAAFGAASLNRDDRLVCAARLLVEHVSAPTTKVPHAITTIVGAQGVQAIVGAHGFLANHAVSLLLKIKQLAALGNVTLDGCVIQRQ